MKTAHSLSFALYPHLIGNAWLDLHEVVRRTHVDGKTPVSGCGSFEIRHGSGWLVRMLLWLMQAPPAGAAIETQLTIRPYQNGERWERRFEDKLLTTTQEAGADGRLIEQIGWLAFRFRLEIIDGGLVYHQECVRLRGIRYIPLPGGLSPQVAAHEKPATAPNRTHVRVGVTLPLIGFLISYEGDIEIKEPSK